MSRTGPACRCCRFSYEALWGDGSGLGLDVRSLRVCGRLSGSVLASGADEGVLPRRFSSGGGAAVVRHNAVSNRLEIPMRAPMADEIPVLFPDNVVAQCGPTWTIK